MAHIPTLFQRPDRVDSPLHVVTAVFNSARYRSRWRLHEDFARMVSDAGATLTTVEVAFGERAHALEPLFDGHAVVRLRTQSELWLKECAINLGVQRLPPDWRYVAWVDADLTFARPDWADETVHRLQHWPVVQMWSEAQDMTPDHEVLHRWRSLMRVRESGRTITPPLPGATAASPYPYAAAAGWYPHAGYAWAARREAWDALGGLFDMAVLGAADWHMAHALLGHVGYTMHRRYTPGYKALLREWEARATRSIRQNVGMVPGLVLHHWHGPKASRRYQTRDSILVECGYDPHVDLKRDWQGLWQLTGRSTTLRDKARRYFHERNEDAI